MVGFIIVGCGIVGLIILVAYTYWKPGRDVPPDPSAREGESW
jgi:hypothetical protein